MKSTSKITPRPLPPSKPSQHKADGHHPRGCTLARNFGSFKPPTPPVPPSPALFTPPRERGLGRGVGVGGLASFEIFVRSRSRATYVEGTCRVASRRCADLLVGRFSEVLGRRRAGRCGPSHYLFFPASANAQRRSGPMGALTRSASDPSGGRREAVDGC